MRRAPGTRRERGHFRQFFTPWRGTQYRMVKQPFQPKSFELIKADIRDAEAVKEAARGADRIVHLAAQVAVTTSVTDPRTDLISTLTVPLTFSKERGLPAENRLFCTPLPIRSMVVWRMWKSSKWIPVSSINTCLRALRNSSRLIFIHLMAAQKEPGTSTRVIITGFTVYQRSSCVNPASMARGNLAWKTRAGWRGLSSQLSQGDRSPLW